MNVLPPFSDRTHGNLFITDYYRVISTAFSLPEYSWSASAISFIASTDGALLHQFNGSGRHLSTLDAHTAATMYSLSYDSQGRLSQVTDGDGDVTTIQRDASGQATAIVGPHGQTTTLGMDTNGYLSSVTNPAGETMSFTYTSGGLMLSRTDARGGTYTYTHDALGRLSKAADPAGGYLELTRTEDLANERSTSAMTTAEGLTTSYMSERYQCSDQHQVNTFPNGLKNDVILQGSLDEKVVFTDGTKTQSKQGSDPRFWLQSPFTTSMKVLTPGGISYSRSATRQAVLSDSSNPLSLTTLTETQEVNGKTQTTQYDAASRTYTLTSPAGRMTTVQVDAQSRVTAQQAPGMAPVSYSHDSHGRLGQVTVGTGSGARVYVMGYGSDGYLSSITDPLLRAVSLYYDGAGRVTKQELPGSRTVLFGYDKNGNLTGLTPPGKSVHSFVYTPVDLISVYTPPSVDTWPPETTYVYNKDRQLTQVIRPDGQTIVMGYDSAGRLGTVTTPSGVTTYTYSSTTGNLTSVAAPSGVTLSYTHDGSLPLSTTWAGALTGSVSRTYNADLKISSISVNSASTASLTYDDDGLLTGAGSLVISRGPSTGFISGTTLGSVTTSRTYSTFGELATTSADFGTTSLYTTSYTRDALGRIIQLDETIEGVSSIYQYDYDLAGRLKKVSEAGQTVAEYSYDDNGNRTSMTGPLGLSVSGTYDAQDRLLTYGSTSYTYTKNGELETRTDSTGTTTYSYDVKGNLLSVILPDGTTVEYVVDGENRRVARKVNGTVTHKWLYEDKLRVTAELDATDAVVSRFVYGTRVNMPEHMEKGGKTYRIVTDHLGSVRLVVDTATGTVAQRLDYDEYGQVLLDTSPGFQPFGFASGLFDPQTKLVRFGARDYDAEVGRWTSKDPILFSGGDANLFSYVLNDPVNRADRSGKFFPIAIGLAWLGAAVSGWLLVYYTSKAIKETVEQIRERTKEPLPPTDTVDDEEETSDRPPPDIPPDCVEEWLDAIARCKAELAKPNPCRGITGGYRTVMDCSRGLVSERCGGNPVEY